MLIEKYCRSEIFMSCIMFYYCQNVSVVKKFVGYFTWAHDSKTNLVFCGSNYTLLLPGHSLTQLFVEDEIPNILCNHHISKDPHLQFWVIFHWAYSQVNLECTIINLLKSVTIWTSVLRKLQLQQAGVFQWLISVETVTIHCCVVFCSVRQILDLFLRTNSRFLSFLNWSKD